MPGTWTPGAAAVGSKVINEPLVVNGVVGMQRGLYSYPPTVTTPATVASGGTVFNSTGYDVMVYAQATGGIGTATTINGTPPFAVAVAASVPVSLYLPANQFISLTYTTTASWKWLAI